MSVEGKLRPMVRLWQRLGDGEAPCSLGLRPFGSAVGCFSACCWPPSLPRPFFIVLESVACPVPDGFYTGVDVNKTNSIFVPWRRHVVTFD